MNFWILRNQCGTRVHRLLGVSDEKGIGIDEYGAFNYTETEKKAVRYYCRGSASGIWMFISKQIAFMSAEQMSEATQ